MRKFLEWKYWKYVVAFLVPAVFLMFLNRGLDNDSWFVLAEGRHLVENGIHHTDVLTMHEGLNVVVQNYGFAAVFYLIYSVFGAPGLYVTMLILNFAICLLIYKICMLISKRNVNLSLIIMLATDLLLALNFVVTRAQMVSYITFLGFIYVLELYVKTGKWKYLWWLPVISLVEINFHASYWWLLFLVWFVYVVDAIKKPKLHLQGYKCKPLLLVGLVSLLVGLINPYGVKMMTYVFTSYGASEITGMVSEMHPFDLRNIFNVTLYIMLVVVSFLYIFGNKKKIRVRYILMFLGFLGLGLNAVKGMSQFVLVMFFPLALMYSDVKIEKIIDAKIGRNALTFWSGIVALSLFVTLCTLVIPDIENGPKDTIVQAVDAIELDSDGNKDAKVYVGYNNGGYVEFRGYKAYIDPRAEVFLDKNNGKENILKEWEDFCDGSIRVEDFLKKYDFDYLILEEWCEKELYRDGINGYELIYEEDGVKALRKV